MLSAVLLLAALGSYALVEGSVQHPDLTSCSNGEEITISDVSIQNAKIGENMLFNFTLRINQELSSDPTLQLTINTQNDTKVECFGVVGSCSYKMCGGSSKVEQLLGQEWNNTCPVPTMTAKETIELPLLSIIQALIGNAPTSITVSLNATDGGNSVGCESFKIDIAPSDK